MKQIRQSLSLKLSLGILLMAVPVFVVALGLLFLQSRRIVRQEAQHRASRVLNTSHQRISKYMRTVETAANANAWLIPERLHPDTLLDLTRRILLLNRNACGCSFTARPGLFPQYGRHFSAYSVRQGDSIVTAIEKPYDYFREPWYKTPATLGRACWVEPFNDYHKGTLSYSVRVASYAMPIYNAERQFLGILATDLSLPQLAEAANSHQPYPHSYFMVTGPDGRYFIHPDSTRLFSHTIFSDADSLGSAEMTALAREMTAGQTGSMTITIDGRESLVNYQPVMGTQWSIALVCPVSDILQQYQSLRYVLVPLMALGLLLLLLLCSKMVSVAISPVRRLLSQSQQIAQGHYDLHLPHSSSNDVVGRLQNSFAAMQEALARHVSDIREANAETTRRNQQLAVANQRAEESARQKALFIQSMTHQIRTPLNIISGFAQVLRDNHGMLPEEEVRSITQMIDHNTKTLNRMVLMLFDSSDTGLTEELQSHKQQPTACNDVARECIRNTYEHFPNLTVTLDTHIDDALTIHTNRLYLIRTLHELLYNAAKYSDTQHITMRLIRTIDSVRFIIQDTGPGIPADYRHLMYEPFSKASDLSEGLGLGLPLARRHAINLGGNLTLDTSYTEGCRFVLSLPAR